MPATTAAPVPYLNPAFDPTPPKPATATTTETKPTPPTKKPTPHKPAIPKPPTTKPAPPKIPFTSPAHPNTPVTTPASITAIPTSAKDFSLRPTPAKSLGTKPSPPKCVSTMLAPPKAPEATPTPTKAPNPAHTLGRRGEDLVAKFIKTRGLVLLCRNWRCREGEIDILATDGHMVVICEVKTRTTDEYGTPADAISAKKIRCIKAATNRWLREFRVPYVPLRYDLAEVWWPPKGKPHLQYRRDAF